MTAPTNPMTALLEHGSAQRDEHELTRDTKNFAVLTLFLHNLKERPLSEQLAFFGMLDQMNEAKSNGEELPSLGSAGADSDIKPEERTLLQAVRSGKLELDPKTKLPKQTVADDSDEMLRPIETELGMKQVTLGDPERRVSDTVEAIKELKTKAADGNDGGEVMSIIENMAKAVKVTRNNGESDEDFTKRVADEVANNKKFIDETEKHLREETGLKPNNKEPQYNFIARMIDALTGSDSKGAGTGWLRSKLGRSQ